MNDRRGSIATCWAFISGRSGPTGLISKRALWLCLSRDPAVRTAPHPDYTHVALSVNADAFTGLAARLTGEATVWKENRSEGQSLYFLDPDGHKLELHVGTLASRLAHYRSAPGADRTIYD